MVARVTELCYEPRGFGGTLLRWRQGILPRSENNNVGLLRGLAPERAPRTAVHWHLKPQALPAWLRVTRRHCLTSPTSAGAWTKLPPICGRSGPCWPPVPTSYG